jgi:hypothetical protein
MASYVEGMEWAERHGTPYVVKMSRRFVPLADWSAGFCELADSSGMPTFSQVCEHHKYGFRTECIGFEIAGWKESGALDQIRRQVSADEPIFVEGFIHQLARSVAATHASEKGRRFMEQNPRPYDRNAYAVWDLMADSRVMPTSRFLWHDSHGPGDYGRVTGEWGLPYRESDFADANMGCGTGEG